MPRAKPDSTREPLSRSRKSTLDADRTAVFPDRAGDPRARVVAGGLTDCQALRYDFTFAGHFVVRRSDILYYDASGTLVKEVIKARFVGTDTNEDNGKTRTDNGTRNITFDFVNGTITESGVLRHVTVPGSGVILLEAGTWWSRSTMSQSSSWQGHINS